MFSDRYGLTKAVLTGQKTMTRRILNEKMLACANDYVQKVHGTGHDLLDYLLEHSLFKVGEIVAVVQAYKDCVNEILVNWGHKTDIGTQVFKMSKGWDNKMFVRAVLMPHKIRITNVRVERLQDISDEDCFLEGIERVYYGDEEWFKAYYAKDGCKCAPTPKEAFAALIDKISGRGTWESNPWVFVYDFELLKEG